MVYWMRFESESVPKVGKKFGVAEFSTNFGLTFLTFNLKPAMKKLAIGVDIGGTKCSVVYGNSEGEIFQKKIFATTNVKENLQEVKESIHGFGTAQAIGVSCGGPLDSQKGQILSPPNLPGWDQIPIADLLREEFGIPVFLKNDADACALAEWKLGAGKGAGKCLDRDWQF